MRENRILRLAALFAFALSAVFSGGSRADEIAQVKGLDMLYIGPSDLGLALGRQALQNQTDPVVMEAVDRILAAAKRAVCAQPWVRGKNRMHRNVQRIRQIVHRAAHGERKQDGQTLVFRP